ncbi:putative exopolyphosphatase [Magnetospirillum sp. LM-5]|uniref:Ppx/GppA phosphatase family protein n=1 Tax=Magnetospirillum sp. LM-5 TaxID=2681466 RepID=UPI00138537E6|nr:Ppx/GppA phosphatase family protein [Magnetospirillum sp. LM-5]CAA7614677.1 putative exopolyphosphatase [Magnetospirillum sp. LM-5]
MSSLAPLYPRDPVFAALDLGTNNCRMLVARPALVGFRVIDAFSRVTRLGEGLAASGRLSDAAMDRTILALKACAEKMGRNRVTHARLVATEACRRADNCAEFGERVFAETGLDLDIISPEEEAALALAGCASLMRPGLPWALVFDIGGGSTEVAWVDLSSGRHDVKGIQSLPLGVVTLTEHLGERLFSADGYDQAVEAIAARLAPFDQRHGIGQHLVDGLVQMMGTSGTVTTLGALHLRLDRYDRTLVDGLDLGFADIAAVTRWLHDLTPSQRAGHPCIGPERADLVIAGCAILEAVCRTWPLNTLRVADRGVREGVLLGLMREEQEA